MTKKQFLAKVNKQGKFMVNNVFEHSHDGYKDFFAILFDCNNCDNDTHEWFRVAYYYDNIECGVNTTVLYTLEQAYNTAAWMMMGVRTK